MTRSYQVFATSHFERDLRSLQKTEAKIEQRIIAAKKILEKDPYNQSGKYDIGKVIGVKIGRWRLRIGSYRLRYDIEGNEVVLYSVKHRREIYLR